MVSSASSPQSVSDPVNIRYMQRIFSSKRPEYMVPND